MEILYSVLKTSSKLYNTGDLKSVLLVLIKTLRLFERMDNKKASSIAWNNPRNIIMDIYEQWEENEDSKILGLKKKDIIRKVIKYYHKSIDLGEKLYDENFHKQGWSVDCLGFMRNLTNRYSNCSLFLLKINNNYDNLNEIERLSMRDLQIARDIDHGVISCIQNIFLRAPAAIKESFDASLNRI